MKKKKTMWYTSLKEAAKIAREMALEETSHYNRPISIYQESDNSYTIEGNQTRKAKFVFAVDKSGYRYTKKWKKNSCNKKELIFVKMEV